MERISNNLKKEFGFNFDKLKIDNGFINKSSLEIMVQDSITYSSNKEEIIKSLESEINSLQEIIDYIRFEC